MKGIEVILEFTQSSYNISGTMIDSKETSAINKIAVLTSNQNVMPPRNIDKFV